MDNIDYNKKYKALNLTSQKFGKLTVLNRVPNNKHNKTLWACLCDCGNHSIAVGSKLKDGTIISCGCAQIDFIKKLGKSRFDDLSGQRFSRLLVIKRCENTKQNKPQFLCLCDCGNKTKVSSANLKNKSTSSCGCFKLEIKKAQFTKHGLSRTKEYRSKYSKTSFNRKKSIPLENCKLRVRDLISKSLKSKGIKKNTETFKILGCNIDYLKYHIERQFTKGMSWDNFKDIHIDHIIPISSAKTENEVYRLNHFTNLRPMWAKDNIAKSDKIEFLI